MFIHVGGVSDKWVGGVMKSASNPDMVVINLMDALGSEAIKESVAGTEADFSRAYS